MSKVWRRLQRVGKKASKYRFTSLSHKLELNCNSKWKAQNVCLIWSHRGRKHSSKLAVWEPSLGNIYEGIVEWDQNDLIEFDVTLYKSINDDKYEEKEWVIMIESEDTKGKRNLLASGKINLENYINIEPFYQQEIKDFKLKPISSKVKSASISFTISSQFIKDGKATDEDMISIASYMSSASTATNNPYLNSNRFNIGQNSDSEQDEQEPKAINVFQDDEDDDFESYFKLNTMTPKAAFNNNIEHHFKTTPQTIRSDNNNDSTLVVAPIIKSSIPRSVDSTPTIANQKNANLTRNKILPSKNSANNEIKLPNPQKLKIVEPKPKIVPIPVVMIPSTDSNNSNPFGDDIDDTDDIEEIQLKNPFVDDIKTVKTEPISDFNNSALDTSNTSRELLVWSQEIIEKTRKASKLFTNIKIQDFSGSWNNGLAFCAIIYYFRPDLIKLSNLSEKDAKTNLKEAFNASDSEKIMRVVDYPDILNRKITDPLSIITYLYQIRDHFETSQQSKEQKSSMKKNNKVEEAMKKLQINELNPFEDGQSNNDESKENELVETKSSLITTHSNPFEDPKPVLRTLVESNPPVSKSSDELIQKAQNLIKKTKIDEKSTNANVSPDSKKKELNQRAKELIAHNRKSSVRKNKPQAPAEPEADPTPQIQSSTSTNTNTPKKISTQKETLTRQTSVNDDLIGTEYVNAEIIKLREMQRELDENGNKLEKQLRGFMRKQSGAAEAGDKELEDSLLREWFLLINKKNALLHRQQELEILQNEKSLEKRYKILSNQLRNLMSIDEDFKTDEERRAEAILFSELISLVNKRNELVLQLDEENKLLNEGELINDFIQNKSTFQEKEKQCILQ